MHRMEKLLNPQSIVTFIELAKLQLFVRVLNVYRGELWLSL